MELQISARSLENGNRHSARCSLEDSLTLGRGPDSPLPLDGIGISREHLRLHAENDRIFITDLSSNGTWLNTRRLTRGEPSPLTTADAVGIPGFEIRIEPEAKPAAGPQNAPPSAAPARPRGALEPVWRALALLSGTERMLILLALATFALAALYLTQTGD